MSGASETAGRVVKPAVSAGAPSSHAALLRLLRKRVLPPVLAFVALIGIWELVSSRGMVDSIILPAPSAIAAAMWDQLSQDVFWKATRITVTETLAGFVVGAGGGLIVGALAASIDGFRRTVFPYAVALNNTPLVAFAPLLLVWFGFGIASKIVMAAVICFFPVLIGVVVGIDTVDKDARMLMRSFGATRWKTFRSLTFPAALPMVFAGFVTSMSLALIGAIVAEFVGAVEGMGVLIQTYNFQLDVADSFAVIVFLALLGLLLYWAMELIYRKVVFWEHND